MNFISGQAFITMMDSLFNEEEWNGIDTSYTSLRIQQLSTYKNDLPPFILSQPMEYQISFLVHLPTLEND